ncbi:MAG: spondin domain-containing protein, partial [Aurantibacter sp.]
FTASETMITSGGQITFTDESTNAPTTWAWEFEGGDPAASSEQNPVVSYNNSGTYEVKLTVTNSGGSDEEVKTDYITVDMQSASYTVTFKGNWSATTHMTDFPSGADHFSALVGMVHKQGAVIFEEGELATSGIEDMAELGNNGDLRDEIDALITSGMALNRIDGGGLGGGTEMTSVTINVTEEFSLVTLVSMIAPSPDWFVSAENVDLFDNGAFVENITVNGLSYDSGTDSGSTFNSTNDDTDPAENIFLITDSPLGNGTTVDPPIAIFTFVKN